MENIIKIVPLWTKLPEFLFRMRSQGRKAFSTICSKSQPVPDPGLTPWGRFSSWMEFVLCYQDFCANLSNRDMLRQTFILLAQDYFGWGRKFESWTLDE
jgi:hypothetical protein